MSAVTRTIEPGITMFTAAEIKVAVVPVGTVPKELMEEYLEKINRFRHVPLAAARSFYRETQKSPFQHLPWSTGCLHFRFVTGEDAKRRTRMSELHMQRQVIALIGIVHCPQTASIQEAYKDFQAISKQFPEAFTYRCFLFEPSEAQVQEDSSNLQNAVMFPPGMNMEQYLEVWMHDMAAAVLAEIEKWMLNAAPSMMKLNTYVDSAEFTGQLAVMEEMQKLRMQISDEEMKEKRKWGRLQKSKADMCLLGGSPRDAADNYKSAMDLAKTSSDYVWYAASVEGMAHARILEALAVSSVFTTQDSSKSAPTSPEMSPAQRSDAMIKKISSAGFGNKVMWGVVKAAKLEEEIRDLLSESRVWYRKRGGAVAVQVEQQLKLARLLAGLKGLGAKREANECATWVMEQLPALPLPEDRVIAVGEVAQVLGLVGLGRKRALLLWHAAELCKGADAGEQALRIAIKALEPPDDPFHQDPDDLPKLHWTLKRAKWTRNWETVHMAALQGALSAARSAFAHVEAWEAAATLLREHQNSLDPGDQRALLEALTASTTGFGAKARHRPGQGPGPLVQLKRVLPLPPSLGPQPLSLAAVASPDASLGPFIFNPFAAKRQLPTDGSHPDWVCGDEGRMELYLSNPLAHPLALERLSLHVTMPSLPEGTPKGWQALPVSVTLPPNGRTVRVTLSVTPLVPGQMVVLGCQVMMGGIQWSQPFTQFIRRSSAGSEVRPPNARGEAEVVDINVLPALPLLRATLKGPDFKLTYPPKEELTGSAASPSPHPSAPPPTQPPESPKAHSIHVHEGQTLTLSLALNNISKEMMSALSVLVSPPKGNPLRPFPGGIPPPDLLGAHVEVDTTTLLPCLPLKAGGSLSLPVRVTVGRCLASFEDVQLEIRISFVGELPRSHVGETDEEGVLKGTQMGRRLVVPLQLVVRPSLQTVSLNCLEQYLPLPDGERPMSAGTSGGLLPWASLHRVSVSSRSARSEEATSVHCSRWGALASVCLLQLRVRNSSDRYFRAWVAPLRVSKQPDALSSSSEMIEPQAEGTIQWPLLPGTTPPPPIPVDPTLPSAVQGPKGGYKGRSSTRESVAAALCADFIAETWALHWELITGSGGQGDDAPRGMLRLSTQSIARDVSPLAVMLTRPPAVHLTCVALRADGELPCTLYNLAASLSADVQPNVMGGNVWAVRTSCGDAVMVEVRVRSCSEESVSVTASLVATTFPGGLPADTPDNLCVSLTGCTTNLTCTIPPGRQHTHTLAAVTLRPGLYQLHVRDVKVVLLDERGQPKNETPELVPAVFIDPLNFLCNL